MKIALALVLCGVTLYVQPMGEGKQATSLEAKYVPLEAGQESYQVQVIDDGSITTLIDTSFLGHTNISGIRKETDDSNNTIDLASIRELHIDQPAYNAKALTDKEFCLAHAITRDGSSSEGLLIPRNVVICGIEKGTKFQKAWFLHRINTIRVQGALTPEERIKQVVDQNVRFVDTGDEPINIHAKKTADKSDELETSVFTQHVEEKAADGKPERLSEYGTKTVRSALGELVAAVLSVLKAIWSFIKRWVW